MYPADASGCGYHRLIWVSEILKSQGHDITVVSPQERAVTLLVGQDDVVREVQLPADTDVVVLQRITHSYMTQAVTLMRAAGVAVVIDVDDDLTTIHPANPAYESIHPSKYGTVKNGARHLHSWNYLSRACRDATFVTTSTEQLLTRYASHGRGTVLHNYLADHYYPYGERHQDSTILGWPASIHSHPNDPEVIGSAVDRVTNSERPLRVFSNPDGIRQAFSLATEPECVHPIALLDWPAEVSKLGIGIAPLADTRFNAAKSWLKPLELAACGVPWVGSPRTEYRRLHDLGCGLLAEKPRDWYRVLRKLSADEHLRLELSAAGVAVANALRLRDHAWQWLEAWEHALKIQRA